jgi:hypothetical protein
VRALHHYVREAPEKRTAQKNIKVGASHEDAAKSPRSQSCAQRNHLPEKGQQNLQFVFFAQNLQFAHSLFSAKFCTSLLRDASCEEIEGLDSFIRRLRYGSE